MNEWENLSRLFVHPSVLEDPIADLWGWRMNKKNFEDPRDSCQRSLTISKDLVARVHIVKFRQRFCKQCISILDEILIKSLANLKDFRTDRLLRSSLSFKEKFSSVRIFLIFEHPAKRCWKPDQEGLSCLGRFRQRQLISVFYGALTVRASLWILSYLCYLTHGLSKVLPCTSKSKWTIKANDSIV